MTRRDKSGASFLIKGDNSDVFFYYYFAAEEQRGEKNK